MTDITRLTQEMKAAAEKAKHAGEAPVMPFDTRISTLNEYQLTVCPDNVLALVEALDLKEEQRANWFQMAQKLGEDLDAAEKRNAELEREHENLRPVGVMSEKAYHRLENRESSFIALWPRPEIYLPRKRPEDGVIVYARTAAIKVEADIVDADVSDSNQPRMVLAVHIDAGDFVKFRGQVYEVEETDFDDHDVTLWFVGGETLKCAAGCQIEMVSSPEEAE